MRTAFNLPYFDNNVAHISVASLINEIASVVDRGKKLLLAENGTLRFFNQVELCSLKFRLKENGNCRQQIRYQGKAI